MKIKKNFYCFILSVILCSISFCVLAVEAPPPENIGPGVITKINTEIEQDEAEKYHKDLGDKKEKQDLNVEKSKIIPAIIKKTTFVLKQVDYSGNTVFTNEKLDEFNLDYMNNEITLDDLKEIMRKISNYYHDEGYISSFAYLPAQEIRNGIVKVNIVESRIGEITVKGNKWTKTSYLKNKILKPKGVEEDKVFNVKDLRKSLGAVNLEEYLKGRVILQKGKSEKGDQIDIILDIKDRFPIDVEVGWDNKGRDLIGNQKFSLRVEHQNLTGYGDSLGVSNYFGNRAYAVVTDYALPVGPYGTKFKAKYGHSRMKLGKQYRSSNVRGKAHVMGVGFEQPIYESAKLKVNSDVIFESITSSTTADNPTLLMDKYEVRALRAAINAIRDDSRGRWISRAEVSAGIPFLGATTDRGVMAGTSKFIKLNPSIVRVQKLPFKITGVIRAVGQWSPQHLFAFEQFQVGGLNSVRGFREGIIFGDYGYFTSIELRRPIPMPDVKYIRALNNKLQLITFADHGFGRESHQGTNINSKEFIKSVGFGLRVFVRKHLTASFDFGIPLGQKITSNQDNIRFHFSINSDLI